MRSASFLLPYLGFVISVNFVYKFLSGMTSRSFQASIPMFSGKNYDDWIFRMKLIFDSYELLDIIFILNGYAKPIDESNLNANQKKKLDENSQKSKKALKIIGQDLDDLVLGLSQLL